MDEKKTIITARCDIIKEKGAMMRMRSEDAQEGPGDGLQGQLHSGRFSAILPPAHYVQLHRPSS